MLWDKLTEENYVVYINRDIDLKIKVFELMENDEIYIKYKGFNLTIPMVGMGVWRRFKVGINRRCSYGRQRPI